METLRKYSTRELCEELTSRAGVEVADSTPFGDVSLTCRFGDDRGQIVSCPHVILVSQDAFYSKPDS